MIDFIFKNNFSALLKSRKSANLIKTLNFIKNLQFLTFVIFVANNSNKHFGKIHVTVRSRTGLWVSESRFWTRPWLHREVCEN